MIGWRKGGAFAPQRSGRAACRLRAKGQTIDELSFLLMRDYIRGAGEVANNKICLKLYAGRADYWTGGGSYEVVFMQGTGHGDNISLVYVSKCQRDFSAERTYLNDGDFEQYAANVDLSGKLPF